MKCFNGGVNVNKEKMFTINGILKQEIMAQIQAATVPSFSSAIKGLKI